MKKQILVISASPRKGGNSDTLCDEFIKGAQDAGNQAEKIFLRDKKIGYCMACDGCKRNPGVCVQKDDMADILNKMIAADAIVLATPVYFYTMDAQLKTLIDRCVARYKEMENKDIYFIATAAAGKEAMERTMESLRGFTACLKGAVEKGAIYGAEVWEKGAVLSSPAMQQAYDMGRSA